MPELPEVEAVRRVLARRVVGRWVREASVRRRDVVRGPTAPEAMLVASRIAAVQRRGKELCLCGQSIEGDVGFAGCVCIHLGMSGSLIWSPANATGEATDPHVHVVWTLDDGSRLTFRDPRRFGGVWLFRDTAQRDALRWSRRGPDALTVRPDRLAAALSATRRPLKAALLEQKLLAGLGNIYADELLHRCRLHPLTPGNRLSSQQVRAMVEAMRRLLRDAVRAGGSTLRDGGYRGGEGAAGAYQSRHAVYGRAGQPCRTCRTLLRAIAVGGRTTVYCPTCQGRHAPA